MAKSAGEYLIKQAAIVGIGVGMGPLVQLIATPWLSRIYTPAEFGYFALFVSSVSVLTTIACLRYEAIIPVVEDDLVKPATLVALLGALAMLLLIGAFIVTGIPQLLYQPFSELGNKIWGMPVAAVCGGIMLLVYYLTLRRGEFILNAVMRSLQVSLFVILAIGFAEFGLIQAQIASWVFVGMVGLVYIGKDLFPLERATAWATAVRFKQYPTLLMPTSLLDALALALPVFLMSATYGAEATGNYAQVQRLVGAPLLLGSAVMGQIFFKYSGELFRSGESSRGLMWRIIRILGVSALVLLIALSVAGAPVCEWLLGKGWRVDTLFLLLVTIPFVCRAVVSPISTVFLTHHRVTFGVRWQVGYFITTCGVLYLASRILTFEYFLLAYAIHEMFLYALYLAMAHRVVSARAA